MSFHAIILILDSRGLFFFSSCSIFIRQKKIFGNSMSIPPKILIIFLVCEIIVWQPLIYCATKVFLFCVCVFFKGKFAKLITGVSYKKIFIGISIFYYLYSFCEEDRLHVRISENYYFPQTWLL